MKPFLLVTSALFSSLPGVSAVPIQGTGNSRVVETYFGASSDDAASHALVQEIRQQATGLEKWLSEMRRQLHQNPELMYQEKETSLAVQSVLNELDVKHSTGWAVNLHPYDFEGPGGYGVVADIGTGQEPCVLLRADMDALPILERTPHIDEFRSKNPGKMHACGHDGHTTMLLGAVAILKSMEHSLNGTVRVMFQPAEEGGAGSKRMREEGILEHHPKPKHAMALHVWPTIPSGTIASRPGPILAACERFEVAVYGVGGHGAMPDLTIDPIVTASAMVMNLQSIVSRNISPLEAGVCSVTKFEAGDAFNVIPDKVLLRGTIRALSTESLLKLRDRVEHIVNTTAATYGCNVTIKYSPDYYPPTVNDPAFFESFSKDVGALVSDEGYVRHMEPTMGAEDFAFIAESIPSTFFVLGQGSGMDPPTNRGLHHPEFALDETVMSRGVELHVNWAIRALRKLEYGEASMSR